MFYIIQYADKTKLNKEREVTISGKPIISKAIFNAMLDQYSHVNLYRQFASFVAEINLENFLDHVTAPVTQNKKLC
jgi:hypothetical protein